MRATLIVTGALLAALLIAQLRPATAGNCSDACDKAYATCAKSCKASNTDCFTKCLNERGSCLAACQ
jgi:hypothetical protein